MCTIFNVGAYLNVYMIGILHCIIYLNLSNESLLCLSLKLKSLCLNK